MSESRHPPSLAALPLFAGVAVVIALWLLLVPWNLSEEDPTGRLRPEGQDSYYAPRIAAVVVIAAIAGGLAAVRDKQWSRLFLGGSFGGVIALFAWRAGSGTSAGANLWLMSLITVVIPGTAIAFVVAYRFGELVRRVAE